MAFSAPTTGFDFESSLSPSEKIKAAKYFAPKGAAAPSLWDKAKDLDLSIADTFDPNAPDIGAAIGLDTKSFLSGFGASTQPAWTFITAPEDISWDTANQASRVDIFGTNNPPVVAGSRGMRDLTLGNALVEGFVRNVTVEGKVAALEKLMEYRLNASDGFVSVPVYQIWANSKSYGGSQGYFIIKDVKVKETMRDLRGDSTRAYVDISLMQVPAYQVNSGRDLAGPVTAGGNVRVNPTTAAGTANSAAEAAKQVDGKTNAAATANPAGPGAGNAQPAQDKVKPANLTDSRAGAGLTRPQQ
jgi:hypothetical protein